MGSARTFSSPMPADFRSQIEDQRAYLLRFASLQLRNTEAAEDVVQETLLAALAGESSYRGQSNLRTWLTGILKHKIVDAIRKKQREPTVASAFGDVESEMDIEDFDAMFNERGGWDPHPAEWGNPEAALSQRQFLDVMDLCLDKLPPNTARVFMMREVMELEADEICKELTINANNLWVILYRARMALRLCLEQNWFARTST
jgi:RNA polymerase sigma-70 factor (ECF subfamily)